MEQSRPNPEMITEVPKAHPEASAEVIEAAGVIIDKVPGTETPAVEPETPAVAPREQFLGASNAHLSPVRMAQQRQNQEMFSAMSAAMAAENSAKTPPTEAIE
jgi:hypothetical protein